MDAALFLGTETAAIGRASMSSESNEHCENYATSALEAILHPYAMLKTPL